MIGDFSYFCTIFILFILYLLSYIRKSVLNLMYKEIEMTNSIQFQNCNVGEHVECPIVHDCIGASVIYYVFFEPVVLNITENFYKNLIIICMCTRARELFLIYKITIPCISYHVTYILPFYIFTSWRTFFFFWNYTLLCFYFICYTNQNLSIYSYHTHLVRYEIVSL